MLFRSLNQHIQKTYGEKAPRIDVLTREEAGVEPNVKGFYDPNTKRVALIADNIGKGEDIHGLLRHEVAVHAKRLGKTDPEFQGILNHLQKLRDEGNTQVQEAYARVPKDTVAENTHEEALAYLSQHAPNLPIVKRFTSWMRRTAHKLTGSAHWLKAEDFGPMADAILKKESKVASREGTAPLYAKTSPISKPDTEGLTKIESHSAEDVIKHGADLIKGAMKLATNSKLREEAHAAVASNAVAKSAGLSKHVSPLETYSDWWGVRSDILRNQFDSLGHILTNALRLGAPDVSEGGLMIIRQNPRLALHNWFERSDKLSVSQKDLFDISRILIGEQWAKEDVAARKQAEDYLQYADVLDKKAKVTSGKGREKYRKLAQGLKKKAKELQTKHGEAPLEGLEKKVTPEQIKWAHSVLANHADAKDWIDQMHEINREAVDFMVKRGMISPETAKVWKSRPYVALFKSWEELRKDEKENQAFFGGSAKSLPERKAIKGGTHAVNIPEAMLRSWTQIYTSGYMNHVRKRGIDDMRLFGTVEKTHHKIGRAHV